MRPGALDRFRALRAVAVRLSFMVRIVIGVSDKRERRSFLGLVARWGRTRAVVRWIGFRVFRER